MADDEFELDDDDDVTLAIDDDDDLTIDDDDDEDMTVAIDDDDDDLGISDDESDDDIGFDDNEDDDDFDEAEASMAVADVRASQGHLAYSLFLIISFLLYATALTYVLLEVREYSDKDKFMWGMFAEKKGQ